MRHSHPYFENLSAELSRAESREKRIDVLSRARREAQEAFPREFAKLESTLLKYNPFEVLAMFAFYDLTYLPEVGRKMNHADPIEQYHIEIVQALVLCHEVEEFAMAPIDPVEFQEVRDLITYVACLHTAKEFPDHTAALTSEQMSALQLRSMLRTHTKAVRGWGYEEQTLRVLRGLYEPFDQHVEKELGIRLTLLIDAILSQTRAIQQRLQAQFTKVKAFMRKRDVNQMVASYLKEFPDKHVSVEGVARLLSEEKRLKLIAERCGLLVETEPRVIRKLVREGKAVLTANGHPL